MAVIDLTGYKWVGNESIDVTSKINLFIDFKDNLDTIYNRITTLYNINFIYSYGTDYSSVAYSNGWNEEFYKTITFTSGTATDYSTGVDKTADLVAWLEANGTLTPPSPTGKKVLKINSKLVAKVNDSLVNSWNGEEIFATPKQQGEVEVEVSGTKLTFTKGASVSGTTLTLNGGTVEGSKLTI